MGITVQKIEETLARKLAKKAKELTEGMQQRVNRNPDIADFETAFENVLNGKLLADWAKNGGRL